MFQAQTSIDGGKIWRDGITFTDATIDALHELIGGRVEVNGMYYPPIPTNNPYWSRYVPIDRD
jgi:hypothetical protein